jgi:hypothetical protein
MTMESERCFGIEELEVVAKLPAHDARRRHLDECPRCRARLLTFLEFTEAPADIPSGLLRDAEATLDAALKRELAIGGAGRSEDAAAPFRRWLAALTAPRPTRRAAWAAAVAVAAIAVVVAIRMRGPAPSEPFLLRGSEERVAPGVLTTSLLQAVAVEGGVELSWPPVAGADSYEVRIYRSDLEELARLRPTPEARALLTRADLPASATPRTTALWKVVALRGGDVVQESAPAPVRLP